MLRTPFCELVGIECPIIQAPIWPAASPALAAAVCNAGGLGTVGAVFGSAERVKQHMDQVRELTDRPFAVNHVVPLLDEDAFATTLEAKPAVVSMSLGQPGDLTARVHDAGAKVIHQVHTVQQAIEAVEQGVDALIAQGIEAGGQGMALGVATMVLIPQIVDAVGSIPVLGAGGIADGRGLAAVLALGGQGVNMGTRFVASQEAAASEAWQQEVIKARSEDLVRFEEWQELFPWSEGTGYPATPRVLRSAFVEKWRGRQEAVKQNASELREEIMEAARKHQLDKLLPFAGQTAGMIRDVVPAETIVRGIVAEAEQALTKAAELAS